MNPRELFLHHIGWSAPIQRPSLKSLPTHGGVFSFVDDSGAVIQTLSAQNIRRMVTARLEAPREDGRRKRADLRSVARGLWWIPTYSIFESKLTYLAIARKMHVNDYRERVAFGPAWFAVVDPVALFPQWRLDTYAFDPTRVEVGPFDRRKDAAEFIELLEDLFDLCRYHPILQQAPHGQRCAYFDMGQCPAPCDGTVSMDAYRRSIESSVRFATGTREPRLAALNRAMTEAAAARDYVRAARTKESLARAQRTLSRCKPRTKTSANFKYLVVQRGSRPSRVKPFIVDRGAVTREAEVRLGELPESVPLWIDQLNQTTTCDNVDAVERSERVWLVAHFLRKADNAPGLFLHVDEARDADNIIDLVRSRFARSSTGKPSKPAPCLKSVDPNC